MLKAIVTRNTTSFAIWPVGCGSPWSSTSFNRISALSEIDATVLYLNDKEDRSYLGCLPIITSNATTLKLSTPHLSVNRIVSASSAQL